MRSSKYLAYVQNGTELHAILSQDVRILTRKKLTKLEIATRGGISEEMARPRTAMSARIAEMNLKTGRNREPPRTRMLGTIDRIIPALPKGRPEKARTAATNPGKCRVRGRGIGTR